MRINPRIINYLKGNQIEVTKENYNEIVSLLDEKDFLTDNLLTYMITHKTEVIKQLSQPKGIKETIKPKQNNSNKKIEYNDDNQDKEIEHNDDNQDIEDTQKQEEKDFDPFDPFDGMDSLDDILNSDDFKEYMETAVSITGYEDNIEAIRKYQGNQNIETRNQIVEKNLSLVRKYAKRYANIINQKEFSEDDLVDYGVLGLIKAIDRFDPDRGFQFSTYATFWIRQSITRALADYGNAIRIPVHMTERINKVRRLESQYLRDYGKIDDKKICEEMELTQDQLDEVRRIRKTFLTMPTLDMPLGEDGDTSLGDMIVDTDFNGEDRSVENDYLDKDTRLYVRQMVEKVLSPREFLVIKMRYGLDVENKARTLDEVGNMFGVTRERIRQIEKKAIRRLNRYAKRSENGFFEI